MLVRLQLVWADYSGIHQVQLALARELEQPSDLPH
jgi:hypothetical protein